MKFLVSVPDARGSLKAMDLLAREFADFGAAASDNL
jgi:hypothetical protein